jgi:hypothetical protein
MMYSVSDSDKRGAKGARDSAMCESDSATSAREIARLRGR